jgi:hypothetical protein
MDRWKKQLEPRDQGMANCIDFVLMFSTNNLIKVHLSLNYSALSAS